MMTLGVPALIFLVGALPFILNPIVPVLTYGPLPIILIF